MNIVFGFFVIGAIFKYCYPYLDTLSDSSAYVEWADQLKHGGFRPIGYSVFLFLLKKIPFDLQSVVFLGQFLLNAVASISFLFSLKSLFRLTKPVFYLFAFFIVCNPIAIYLTNHVMSDSIFYSLSLIYITSGLWVLKRTSKTSIIIHILVIIPLLYIRYTALVYPIISIVLFWQVFKKSSIRVGYSFILLAISFFFYNHIQTGTFKELGIAKFSAFGEWQLSNNALHIVPHINLEAEAIEDEKARFVHSVVMQSFSENKNLYPKDGQVSYNFMWDKASPLKKCLTIKQGEWQWNYWKTWTHMGDYFKAYGWYLIKNYPREYFSHYILPSLKRFFNPPTEILSGYTKNQPNEVVRRWLGKEDEIFEARFDYQSKLVPFMRFTNFIMLFGGLIIGLLSLLQFKKWKAKKSYGRSMLIWLSCFLLLYSAFITISSPAILRTVFITYPIILILAANYWHWTRREKSLNQKTALKNRKKEERKMLEPAII